MTASASQKHRNFKWKKEEQKCVKNFGVIKTWGELNLPQIYGDFFRDPGSGNEAVKVLCHIFGSEALSALTWKLPFSCWRAAAATEAAEEGPLEPWGCWYLSLTVSKIECMASCSSWGLHCSSTQEKTPALSSENSRMDTLSLNESNRLSIRDLNTWKIQK